MPSRTLASGSSGCSAPDRAPGLVSVIIPVHNRPKLLVEAVESVLAQTYRDLEILIVDDGSTDDTPAVAARLAEAHPERVHVLRRAQGGPGLARETGRIAARGEFIQYLDSDDLLLPRKFELQVAALRAIPAASVSYGITQEIEADGSPTVRPERPSNEPIDRMFPRFLLIRWWQTASPLYRAEATDRVGPWTDLWLEEDWEYDCRIAALDRPVCFVPEIVCQHRHLAGPRLSRGEALDPRRLKFRARAHELIAEHATRSGIARETPEMAHYSRELFLLARQCGAGGLIAQSRRLFALSRHLATTRRSLAADFRIYLGIACLLGWGRAGKLSDFVDRIRSKLRERPS